ncbi:hypothetical protein ACOME3_003742 [Neoechinorhynchus agilis]
MYEPIAGPSTGMTVKACGIKSRNGRIEQFNIRRRPLLKDDVLVEVLYCCICQCDQQVFVDCTSSEMKLPVVPGHQVTGVVYQVGETVTELQQGDYVAIKQDFSTWNLQLERRRGRNLWWVQHPHGRKSSIRDHNSG